MASVIYGGAETASAVLFQPMVSGISDYLSTANQYVMDKVSDVGRGFMSAMNNFRQRVSYDKVLAYREASREAMVALGTDNSVVYLGSAEAIVTAPAPMRQWMMVNPYIRKYAEQHDFHLWNKDVVQYTDDQSEDFYQYVMNNQVTDDGLVSYYSAQISALEEGYQYTQEQLHRIQDSWNTMLNCITVEEVDPTDPYLRFIG